VYHVNQPVIVIGLYGISAVMVSFAVVARRFSVLLILCADAPSCIILIIHPLMYCTIISKYKGVTYPAQLVNLPCPIEVHKTLDHASYYKAADVAQMLIVYEDELSFDEAQEKPIEGFPSYYHSGLTPPMKRVVERRFERVFTSRGRKAIPPPRAAVQDVEEQLLELMERLQKDDKGTSASNKRTNKLPVLTTATKELVEVEEEVVDYEPWMDDGGKQPHGIEFEAEESIAKHHPDIWLPAETIRAIKDEIRAAQEAERQKEEAAAAAAAAAEAQKKEKAAKKKSKKKAAARAVEEAVTETPKQKKGIPSRKNATPVDELTQAAMGALSGDPLNDIDILGGDDFFDDFDLNEMENL
jgi:transcription initiation factor TFIID subunit 7